MRYYKTTNNQVIKMDDYGSMFEKLWQHDTWALVCKCSQCTMQREHMEEITEAEAFELLL